MNNNCENKETDLNIDYSDIENMISKYAAVRKEMEDCKKTYPKYLAGNDNYIGIFGEYWAIRFFEQFHNNEIKQFLNDREDKKVSKSEKWVDIKLVYENKKEEYISVKTIFEDQNGTSGSIKYRDPEENKIFSIVIIKLNGNLIPEELLYIKDIDSNLVNGMKDYQKRWESDKDLAINFRYYSYGFDPALQTIYKYDKCNSVFYKKA